MPDSLYIVTVVAATSIATYVVGRRRGLRSTLLAPAVRRGVRYAGVCLFFWGVNVAVGAAVALLVRGLGLGFIWLYTSADVSVLVLAATQALVFESWRVEHERTQSTASALAGGPEPLREGMRADACCEGEPR